MPCHQYMMHMRTCKSQCCMAWSELTQQFLHCTCRPWWPRGLQSNAELTPCGLAADPEVWPRQRTAVPVIPVSLPNPLLCKRRTISLLLCQHWSYPYGEPLTCQIGCPRPATQCTASFHYCASHCLMGHPAILMFQRNSTSVSSLNIVPRQEISGRKVGTRNHVQYNVTGLSETLSCTFHVGPVQCLTSGGPADCAEQL